MAARPRPAPPPIKGVSWFGQFVRTEDNGRIKVYNLPTGGNACREFMLRMSMNQDEAILAAAYSSDILFKVAASDNLADVQAKLLQREGYFRAILIQSHGMAVQPPVVPCGDGTPFSSTLLCILETDPDLGRGAATDACFLACALE
ncbi:hypothetical protein GGR51DRAFT_560371 [Nemania sp. FL0031]|nr:hypothetical protein GGR51DRAFT_560371 [Nemania sp. FL0031]